MLARACTIIAVSGYRGTRVLKILNSLVKHQSSTQAKKQQQNSLVPEAKCQSDVYQAGRLKLGVGTVPFKNAGSAPALAA